MHCVYCFCFKIPLTTLCKLNVSSGHSGVLPEQTSSVRWNNLESIPRWVSLKFLSLLASAVALIWINPPSFFRWSNLLTQPAHNAIITLLSLETTCSVSKAKKNLMQESSIYFFRLRPRRAYTTKLDVCLYAHHALDIYEKQAARSRYFIYTCSKVRALS